MRITVTKDDIDYAQRQDRWACAIVRAIQRENPAATFVRVDAEKIAFSDGGHRYTYSTPRSAVDRIIRPFDEGRAVRPTTFEVRSAPTIRQVQKLDPETKSVLRTRQRIRQLKEQTKRLNRTHNRFCEDPA